MSIRNFEKEAGFEYRIINDVTDLYTGKPTEKMTNRIEKLEKDGFSIVKQDVKTGISQKVIVMRKAEKKPEKVSEKKVLEKLKETKKQDVKITPTK